MIIYIPTRNRPRQITATFIPVKWRARTVFVAPTSDLQHLKRFLDQGFQFMPYDKPPGISAKRQWILERSTDPKICMFDDDLNFCARMVFDQPALRPAEPPDMYRILEELESMLTTYAHGSVSIRAGNNRLSGMTEYVTRALRAHAYRADILKKHNVRFDRVLAMQDFDVTLQLLRKGYKNFLITRYCQDQPASGAKGGCSTYRTAQVHAEAAKALAALHPEFVKVVEKTTKAAWGGDGFGTTRTDVRVSWAKAYASAAKTNPKGPTRVPYFRL